MAEELGLDTFATGVFVLGLEQGSAAARLGVRLGDIVLEVNGQKVDTVTTLREMVAKPAARWQLTMRRGERVLTTTVQG